MNTQVQKQINRLINQTTGRGNDPLFGILPSLKTDKTSEDSGGPRGFYENLIY